MANTESSFFDRLQRGQQLTPHLRAVAHHQRVAARGLGAREIVAQWG